MPQLFNPSSAGGKVSLAQGTAYSAANVITVYPFTEFSDAGTAISKSTNTTVDFSTTGAGGFMASGNLAGTVTCTGSSNTITGTGTQFLTDFKIGGVITVNGSSRRITGIASDTSLNIVTAMPAATGANYQRNAGRAGRAEYYLYALSGSSGVTVGISTRHTPSGDQLVDFPSGYEGAYQLLGRYFSGVQNGFSYWTDAGFSVRNGSWEKNQFILYDALEPGLATGANTYNLNSETIPSKFKLMDILICAGIDGAESQYTSNRITDAILSGVIGGASTERTTMQGWFPLGTDGRYTLTNGGVPYIHKVYGWRMF